MTTAPAPDYASGSLADVLPAVARAMGIEGYHPNFELAAADRVAVLLVDGLGANDLAAYGAAAPVLASLTGCVIDSGFPSTTAVGLASLGSGRAPGAHGLVGTAFLVPEWGGMLAPLRWGTEPNPVATQPDATMFERLGRKGVAVSAVGASQHRGSGLTKAILRGADYVVADTIDEMSERTRTFLRGPGRALAYVYWADLDKAGHVYGPGSAQWLAELAIVDGLVGRLLEALPADGLLHVTADHGMVDTAEAEAVAIGGELLLGVRAVGGEPRARHIYTERGAAREVAARWGEQLRDRAWVLTRHEALAADWFGTVDPDLADRIGDVVVAATGNVKLTSDVDVRLSSMRGQHGSLTPAEMQVPLLSGRR